MDAAKIRIAVDADASAVGPTMAAVGGSVGRMADQVQASFKRITAGFSALPAGTKALTGFSVGAALAATALGAAIGPAIKFESAFAGVKKTVDGTPQQLDAIRTGLIGMSTVMPTSAADLASIAENAGQLGVAAGDVLEFTRVIAMLGETTDLDFDQAAQSLARFLNITDGSASISQIADVIVELGNNSATTESQIVTFATRMASAFTVAGASEDQVLALGSAFSSLGVEAEAGSSALNRVITQIADAAKLGGDDLKVFAETAGLLPEEFAAIAESNPVEALVLFGEGLGRLTEQGRSITPVLEQLDLAGIRTSRVMQLLALGSDQVRNQLALAATQMEEGGAAAEEFGRRTETTASRLAILQNRIAAIALAVGTPLLGNLAIGADLAGDAIERLAQLLAPLAGELSTVFANLAAAASLFFEVLGGPALGVAVAGLIGLTTTLTGLLQVFNSLGPAGVVIAALIADLILVGPVSIAAASGMTAFGAATATATVPLAAFRAAVSGLQAALAAGPLIAFTAALVFTGKAFYDADTAARAAADGFREALGDALQTNDLALITAELDRVNDRMNELSETSARGLSVTSWRDWGTAIQGTAQILTPFTENTVVNAQKELEALNEAAADSRMGVFADSVRLASQALGVSQNTIIATATELGVLEQLTQGTTAEFYNAVDAIGLATVAEQLLADQSQVLYDKMQSGNATLQDFADELGTTTGQLAFMAEQIDGVKLEDLLDPDKAYEAFDAIQALNDAYGNLAGQVGLTTEEYIGQIQQVEQLAASHSELRKAIDGVSSAMDLLDAQQIAVTAATEDYDAALAGLDGSEESYIALVGAAKQLALEQAALAPSARDAVAGYEALAKSVIEAGVAMGLSEDRAIDLAASLLGIDRAYIVEIQDNGAEVQARVDAIDERAQALGEKLFGIEFETIDEEALNDIEGLVGLAEGAVGAPYTMTLDADDQASDLVNEIEGLASSVAQADYIMRLQATDAGAEAEIATRHGQGRAYADDTYDPGILAHDAGAQAAFASGKSQGDDFGDGPYDAAIEAHDAGAQAEIRRRKTQASDYAGTYTATLKATDLSAGTVSAAIRRLLGFQSKTITLRSVYTTSGSAGVNKADGGFHFADGGIAQFNDGGMAGSFTARPGGARIFAPVAPGVQFAELETGGEAYIPLAGSKRPASISIWEETGRRLGVLPTTPDGRAGGGGQTINASMPITVNASPGMDEGALARAVGQQVNAALRATAREIANTRG